MYRRAIDLDPEAGQPSGWNAVATHVPPVIGFGSSLWDFFDGQRIQKPQLL